jgi:hypothetical protein
MRSTMSSRMSSKIESQSLKFPATSPTQASIIPMISHRRLLPVDDAAQSLYVICPLNETGRRVFLHIISESAYSSSGLASVRTSLCTFHISSCQMRKTGWRTMELSLRSNQRWVKRRKRDMSWNNASTSAPRCMYSGCIGGRFLICSNSSGSRALKLAASLRVSHTYEVACL